jgi:hypothetical protein
MYYEKLAALARNGDNRHELQRTREYLAGR